MSIPPSYQSRGRVFIGLSLLAIQTALLAWSAYIHSPTPDEIAYLPGGISHWQFGRFELVRANPPLVRMVAALPVLVAGCETDWSQFDGAPGRSTEFEVGKDFLAANGFRSFWLFALARWACIPFVLLGGAICWWWAHELYGPLAGLAALALWCFCPNVLGNGALMTPDAATTSLGVAAAYTFWHWLRAPDWSAAWLAGLVLGFAELAKTNWLVLFALWPILWAIWRFSSRHTPCAVASPLFRDVTQFGLILALAILVINAGYGFDDTFQPLGQFQFQSRTLRGDDLLDTERGLELGNRFRNGCLARVPVPLPEQYVQGIDTQKFRSEKGRMAYLFGVWKFRGWWYYYLAAATVKVPVGVWILLGLAIAARLSWRTLPASVGCMSETKCTAPCAWRDELILLAPAIATLIFISSQTGINRHFRYALPIFPFLYVWLSSLAVLWSGAPRQDKNSSKDSSPPSVSLSLRLSDLRYLPAALATTAFAWAMTNSLLVYPHSLSYFNELAGGPRGGARFLLDSNTDWGQDLLLIKQWIDDHPEARPIYIAWAHNYLQPSHAGLDAPHPPSADTPGWHLISVNSLHSKDGQIRALRCQTPTAFIGGSTAIFHVHPQPEPLPAHGEPSITLPD